MCYGFVCPPPASLSTHLTWRILSSGTCVKCCKWHLWLANCSTVGQPVGNRRCRCLHLPCAAQQGSALWHIPDGTLSKTDSRTGPNPPVKTRYKGSHFYFSPRQSKLTSKGAKSSFWSQVKRSFFPNLYNEHFEGEQSMNWGMFCLWELLSRMKLNF